MTIVKFIHGAVRTISSVRGFGLMLGLVLLSVVAAEARPYQLAWDRNSDGLTTGYRVYYGTASGSYQPTQGVDVGNVDQFTVDLTPGQRYYFRVRAYNSSAVLGPASTELSFTVPLGATVSVNTASISPGATIVATIAHGPGSPQDFVGLYRTGASSTAWTDWKHLNGTRTAPATGMTGGTVSFVAPSTAGTYEVRFYSGASALLASSVPITVGAGTASITAGPSSLNVGQTITVSVSNGPASRFDLVALYPASSTNASGYLDWKFLNGTQSAPATGLSNATVSFTAPTQAGQYRVRLLYNNSSTVLATSGIITVSAVATPPPPPPPSGGVAVTLSVTSIAAAAGNFTAQIANGPGGRLDWVALLPVGAPNNLGNVQWFYLNGSRTPPSTGRRSATVSFAAPGQAGQYNVRFFANDGFTVLATSPVITVTSATQPPPSSPPPSGSPRVTPSATSVAPGGNVTAQVTNGPAGRMDWVGLFPVGAGATGYVDWFFLNGSKVAPSSGVATANVVFRIPSSGQYNLRLFPNNGFTALSTSGTITAGTTTSSSSSSSNPTVTPSATTVARNSLITVTVANGPGSRFDWVGIYAPSQGGANFADWFFLNGTKVAPGSGLRNTSFSLRVPGTPGTYVLRFYANNSYTALLANSVNIIVQ